MAKVLLETDEHAGRYVALRSRDDNTVVGFGDTPVRAVQAAQENGCASPILFYVPERPVVYRRGGWPKRTIFQHYGR